MFRTEGKRAMAAKAITQMNACSLWLWRNSAAPANC
jgi:hypothetical protein